GYEELRKHPEYALYDANGQFAVDRVYGGYPNPMELASPLEVGTNRVPKKPYLNRSYTPWQHAPANYAITEGIEYGARCIKRYAERWGFDGVFIDGAFTVTKGFGYDGKVNIPSDRKAVARLNTRIQKLYHRILKQDNPWFGTWYNFSIQSLDWRDTFGRDYLLGMGLGDDVNDRWIRAMNRDRNVSCLAEWAGTLHVPSAPVYNPAKCLRRLCENRDYIVQKYGGNVIIGYLQGGPIERLGGNHPPGPSKWGWPTVNYYLAQIIASQHHVMICAAQSPSLEPTYQFQTRFSSLLWAPDIRLEPNPENTVNVKTPEAVWWKPLVYRRETKDGYDLIVHLVRIPPTEHWDLDWVDEPVPLEGLELTADIGRHAVKAAYACRPYQFEEPQQAVQRALTATISNGKATVTIPSFRYYTMVVLRVER
ncbi:MAG: hypothetical protein PHR35_16625, partial [Kiritimatiellae bacterium]|nr:hypothetical protein [Kiritimatiellia bacterium]